MYNKLVNLFLPTYCPVTTHTYGKQVRLEEIKTSIIFIINMIEMFVFSIQAVGVGTFCLRCWVVFNPYPTAFLYGNGMVLHFYQQQESSTTKTVHKVINKGLKAYV